MNKDKDLIDACDKKPKRPVNLSGRLFISRSDVELAGEVNHTHGRTDDVMPVYTVVHEP